MNCVYLCYFLLMFMEYLKDYTTAFPNTLKSVIVLCFFGLYEKRFQHMFSFLLECFSPLGNMLIKLIMKIAQIYLNVLRKVYLTLAVIETSVAFHIYVWVRVRSYTLQRHSILLYIYRSSWNLTYTLCIIIKYVFFCLCYIALYSMHAFDNDDKPLSSYMLYYVWITWTAIKFDIHIKTKTWTWFTSIQKLCTYDVYCSFNTYGKQISYY